MREFEREIIFLQQQDDSEKINDKVCSLHLILSSVESTTVICNATEIINLNNYTIINSHKKILKMLTATSINPFMFCLNKN